MTEETGTDRRQPRWPTWLVLAVALLCLAALGAVLLRPMLGPHRDIPFTEWYHNWPVVFLAAAIFIAFLLGFVRPREAPGWRSAGMGGAFFIALFTEMFGVPLTIYFLSGVIDIQPGDFGHRESHLWAFLLDRLGILPLELGVYLVMAVSTLLIACGVVVAALGWRHVYQARGRLVTDGVYRFVRHPQYLGFFLVIAGFLIQWPTLLTLIMAPVLFIMYTRLARREERIMRESCGAAYESYMQRTGAFLPRPRRTS